MRLTTPATAPPADRETGSAAWIESAARRLSGATVPAGSATAGARGTDAMDAESLLQRLSWRYAVQKFDAARRIDDATWHALEQSLRLAPSSFGLQPWKFAVVTAPHTKQQLAEASYGQRQPVDCSHYVVFAARRGIGVADIDRYLAEIARTRSQPVESLAAFRASMLAVVAAATPEELDAWTARQAHVAIGFFLGAAAMLHVDTCPLEGIDKPAYDRILGFDRTGHAAVAAVAAGYRAANDPFATLKKVRFDVNDLIVRF